MGKTGTAPPKRCFCALWCQKTTCSWYSTPVTLWGLQARHVEEIFYSVRIAPTPAFTLHMRLTIAADLVPVGCLWAHHHGVEAPAVLYVTCRLWFCRKKMTAVIFIIALPQPLFLWFILPEEISFLYHLTFLDIAAWTKFMSRIKLCPLFIESRYFS